MNYHSIELITAINNANFLEAACASPADGIYLPLSGLVSIRWKRDFFSLDQLGEIVAAVHRAGKWVYPVINGQIRQLELTAYQRAASRAYACGADGLVLGDAGLLSWFQNKISPNPEFKLIVSSSACASTREDLLFWKGLGANRVILPRLQSLSEVSEITRHSPVDIELFVHGLVCPTWEGVTCLWPMVTFADQADWGCCISLEGEKAPCTQYWQPYGTPFWVSQVYSDLEVLKLLTEPRVSSIKIIPATSSPEAFHHTLELWQKAVEQVVTSRQQSTPQKLGATLSELSAVPVRLNLRRLKENHGNYSIGN